MLQCYVIILWNNLAVLRHMGVNCRSDGACLLHSLSVAQSYDITAALPSEIQIFRLWKREFHNENLKFNLLTFIMYCFNLSWFFCGSRNWHVFFENVRNAEMEALSLQDFPAYLMIFKILKNTIWNCVLLISSEPTHDSSHIMSLL